MKPDPASKVLTTGETAKLAGVSFMTVLRWISRGLLPAYSLPGRGDRRIRLDDLQAFLKSQGMPLPTGPVPGVRRVLVVDDDHLAAKFLARALASDGYEVEIAADGFSAGTKVLAFQPDVMTLDLRMPGLGGLDVLARVRSDPRLKHLRVVVVSALPAHELKRAMAAGADAALRKPVDLEVLLKTVHALTGRRLKARRKK